MPVPLHSVRPTLKIGRSLRYFRHAAAKYVAKVHHWLPHTTLVYRGMTVPPAHAAEDARRPA
ncbi:MAG: hypothetical protein GX575_17365 [Candidatus Anammoximicrobium sp.]|nr:hypothetical protein [Candidatus Anammoximicrobium sp.]